MNLNLIRTWIDEQNQQNQKLLNQQASSVSAWGEQMTSSLWNVMKNNKSSEEAKP